MSVQFNELLALRKTPHCRPSAGNTNYYSALDTLSRADRIRTCDLLTPSQTRYQTAPRPERCFSRVYYNKRTALTVLCYKILVRNMSRPPKPWYWNARDSWFVTINGTRHNLGPDKEDAEDQFHQLMLTRRETTA